MNIANKQMTYVHVTRNVLNDNTFGDLNFFFLHSSGSLFNFFNYWLLYNCKHFKEIVVLLEFLFKYFHLSICVCINVYIGKKKFWERQDRCSNFKVQLSVLQVFGLSFGLYLLQKSCYSVLFFKGLVFKIHW